MFSTIWNDTVGFAEDMGMKDHESSLNKSEMRESAGLQNYYHNQQLLNNPLNTVRGLEKAGLNPALASGMPLTSTNASGGSSGSHSGHKSEPSKEGMLDYIMFEDNQNFVRSGTEKNDEQAETERTKQELNEAERDVKRAEEERLLRENEREDTYDSTINMNFNSAMDSWIAEADSEAEKKLLTDMKMQVGQFNKGSMRALMDFNAMDLDRRQKMLEKAIVEAKKNHNVPETLAKMPKAELAKLLALKAQIIAEAGKLKSETKLNDEKVKEVRSNVKRLDQETKSILHNDPVEMWNADEGDWSIYMLSSGLRDVMHGAGQGLGYGVTTFVSKGKNLPQAGGLSNMPKKSNPKSPYLPEQNKPYNISSEKAHKWAEKRQKQLNEEGRRIRSGFPATH